MAAPPPLNPLPLLPEGEGGTNKLANRFNRFPSPSRRRVRDEVRGHRHPTELYHPLLGEVWVEVRGSGVLLFLQRLT